MEVRTATNGEIELVGFKHFKFFPRSLTCKFHAIILVGVLLQKGTNVPLTSRKLSTSETSSFLMEVRTATNGEIELVGFTHFNFFPRLLI
jgi:hypothetical protein